VTRISAFSRKLLSGYCICGVLLSPKRNCLLVVSLVIYQRIKRVAKTFDERSIRRIYIYVTLPVSNVSDQFQYLVIENQQRMFSASLSHVLPFSVIVTHSLALTIPVNNAELSLTQPSAHTNMTSNLALAFSARNLSISAPPIVQCDGSLYKRDLVKSSCVDAISTIPNDAEILTFGDRGFGSYDIPLPHRFISCEPSSHPPSTR
jgi:hypothetical protein